VCKIINLVGVDIKPVVVLLVSPWLLAQKTKSMNEWKAIDFWVFWNTVFCSFLYLFKLCMWCKEAPKCMQSVKLVKLKINIWKVMLFVLQIEKYSIKLVMSSTLMTLSTLMMSLIMSWSTVAKKCLNRKIFTIFYKYFELMMSSMLMTLYQHLCRHRHWRRHISNPTNVWESCECLETLQKCWNDFFKNLKMFWNPTNVLKACKGFETRKILQNLSNVLVSHRVNIYLLKFIKNWMKSLSKYIPVKH
jgi:hypothetical protein